MKPNYNIYLICYFNGKPLDFLLPVCTEHQLASLTETAGTAFKIKNPHNAEILIACRKDLNLQTLKINIESACKKNSNISFKIIINEENRSAYLRAYTDEKHFGNYPLPKDFLENSIAD